MGRYESIECHKYNVVMMPRMHKANRTLVRGRAAIPAEQCEFDGKNIT